MEAKDEKIRVILTGVRNSELGEKEALGRIINVLMPNLGDRFCFVIDLVQNNVISPEEGVDDILSHQLN